MENDRIVTINLTINGTTITGPDGTYVNGETVRTFAEMVTITGNVLTFAEDFEFLAIQPNLTVGLAIGTTANANNSFLVGPAGCQLPIKGSKVSLYSSESVVVSILAIM